MTLPLNGLRVLDLSRVLAGPYCAQLLADHGADVIKIEAPEGDENRHWGTAAANGNTCNYNAVNRGKRCITLNLKSVQARDLLQRLVMRADILIHSFLPDSARRLGLDYAQLKSDRPELIFCSLSGYGEHGPMRNDPGYDMMVQAFSGIMSMTGPADGPPVRVGVAAIDMATGLTAYGGIMTALHHRTRTGEGSWVQVSLLQTAISLLGYHGVTWLQSGVMPRRQGSSVWHLVPYQAFRCEGGDTLLVGVINDASWQRLCQVLERPDLLGDERFGSNYKRMEHRSALIPALEAEFARKPIGYWLERCTAHGVAVAPMHTIDQALAHPQVTANRLVTEVRTADGLRLPQIGLPFILEGISSTAERAAPALGADTHAVLRDELGLSTDDIAALAGQGAI